MWITQRLNSPTWRKAPRSVRWMGFFLLSDWEPSGSSLSSAGCDPAGQSSWCRMICLLRETAEPSMLPMITRSSLKTFDMIRSICLEGHPWQYLHVFIWKGHKSSSVSSLNWESCLRADGNQLEKSDVVNVASLIWFGQVLVKWPYFRVIFFQLLLLCFTESECNWPRQLHIWWKIRIPFFVEAAVIL